MKNIQWGNCIISAFVGVGLTLCFNYFFDVKPSIQHIETDTSSVLEKENEIQTHIENIEKKYLQKDNEGINCTIGISSDLKGNHVSVFKNNRFGLESQDVIFIKNPFGLFTPTVAFIVYTVNGSDSDSGADLFVSKEGMEKLDISPKQFKQGLFEMKLRFRDKNMQNKEAVSK